MADTFISKVATIEIPVANIEKSLEWYVRVLNLSVLHKDETTAMLSFNTPGVPTLFLVGTDDTRRLVFANTPWNIPQSSVIDLYADDLEQAYTSLQSKGVEVGALNVNEQGYGGFGFEDLDGNVLSVCNIDHDQSI
ncbi:catechol 2,3-dioxygenase-like lactoylglutathione lyase family enzyme [Pullulanibacillus pueri]|uniref:VOC domain-containing protein n=1 Tax=Pullulanibacillus pueri TaxID=1437324 RepID=A0A8J2ZXE0_9BACL|nr:VOC family protein [Pullulanibacillus pueri]MBM7684012.1 catechol 2,3-dioxygenase-like lactoylglutathione lyase family enzyme [Pullulanibacillus pueri]GGH85090.1 hypothetical protein GCM10007096_29670 [Pullulanibacillus pueri]